MFAIFIISDASLVAAEPPATAPTAQKNQSVASDADKVQSRTAPIEGASNPVKMLSDVNKKNRDKTALTQRPTQQKDRLTAPDANKVQSRDVPRRRASKAQSNIKSKHDKTADAIVQNIRGRTQSLPSETESKL
jgi:hypothetical protein